MGSTSHPREALPEIDGSDLHSDGGVPRRPQDGMVVEPVQLHERSTDAPAVTSSALPVSEPGSRRTTRQQRGATTDERRTRTVIRLRPRRSHASPSRRRLQAVLVLSDAVTILLAMATARSWSPAAWAYGSAVLICLGMSGGYQARLSMQALPELPKLMSRLAVPTLFIMPLGLIGLNRAVFLQVLVMLVLLCLARILICAGIRSARRKGHLRETALIVGSERWPSSWPGS
jgi:hypothetical protein